MNHRTEATIGTATPLEVSSDDPVPLSLLAEDGNQTQTYHH